MVTSHGPRRVAKSFPFAGPRFSFISSICSARADQSFMIVRPKIAVVGLRATSRFLPSVPDDDGGLELVVEPLEVELARRARRPGPTTPWWLVK